MLLLLLLKTYFLQGRQTDMLGVVCVFVRRNIVLFGCTQRNIQKGEEKKNNNNKE